MIISSPSDFRAAAERRLPRFLFDYIDGGANDERTLRRNSADLTKLNLVQRVLNDVSDIQLECELFGRRMSMPLALAPVGLTGMYARRGETLAARAAASKGIPYCLSTVSICSLEEVTAHSSSPIWFQLYVLRDRGFMRDVLEKAKAVGVKTLVFTVDMPVPGSRYRDAHSGLSGPHAPLRRWIQAAAHPRWAWDVGLRGRPHSLGNVVSVLGKRSGLEDFIGWLGANFDPSIQWRDLEWIRDSWQGSLVIKGVLDPNDARAAQTLGADGVVASNHGGRQLDGVLSTVKALPAIVDAVGDRTTVLADSGIRSGLDVVRMLALGAKGVLLGRSYIYALAARGEDGVTQLLDIFEKEMRVAMALTGVRDIAAIDRSILVP
jgi:L-lactate dehydrogenase (cytochrome)